MPSSGFHQNFLVFLTILFLGPSTIVNASFNLYIGVDEVKTLLDECRWSYCAGYFVSGVETCHAYGSDWRYTGQYASNDCDGTNLQVYCCRPTQDCIYTRTCFGTQFKGARACDWDFGDAYKQTGKSQRCVDSHASHFRWECCKK